MAEQAREPYYLAVDPGLHTGWATWDEKGKAIMIGDTHTFEALHEFLAGLPTTVKVVIVEDFFLFKQKARSQAGSRMPAPEAIGMVKTFARLWGARIEKQGSNVKPLAEKMTGVHTKDYKTGRLLMPKEQTHKWDAFNHGEYWLYTHNVKQQSIEDLKRSIQ